MNEITHTQNRPPGAPRFIDAPIESPYKGVGGWLLLFCIGLTVLTPVLSLRSLGISYFETFQYFGQYPGLLVVTIVDTVLSLSLIAFSIYVGVSLWTIRRGAVQMAKRYLVCFLGYHLVAAALPFMAGLSAEANEGMIMPVVKDVFKAVVYVAIWYSYLNSSKRVSATYNS